MAHRTGKDLSFITIRVMDKNGLTVPQADNKITCEIEGKGEIIATDNGDATDFTPFPSHGRKAFNGLALVIVRAKPGEYGSMTVIATSPGLKEAKLVINCQ